MDILTRPFEKDMGNIGRDKANNRRTGNCYMQVCRPDPNPIFVDK